MPLSIGFVGAYAKAHLGDVEIRLFKRPELIIDAIRSDKPDVIGLSYYVWNANLNDLVFRIAKRERPNILNVGGGPMITDLNSGEEGATRFFAKQPFCDVFVVNQGEIGFVELIRRFTAAGGSVRRLKAEVIPGCLTNCGEADSVLVGPRLDNIKLLDDIPSPYLTGIMDQFFDEPFIPMIETNRSCPYKCTFCAWGVGTQKLASFGEDRVLAEIDYIAGRHPRAANMLIADANFGILERDTKIARRLYENHVQHGFPGHVEACWSKALPDRVMRVFEEFRGIAEIVASMQTLTPEVLTAVKRKNLPLERVVEMHKAMQRHGYSTHLFSELIVGLPMESFESHLESIRRLIDAGCDLRVYRCELLPGTELDLADSRERYVKRSGYHLVLDGYGVYEGDRVFEAQEVVTETTTMPESEMRRVCLIHMLLQLMWGRKWYYDFLRLFKQRGIHPLDVVLRVADAFSRSGGELGEVFDAFCSDQDLEAFESEESLYEYWSRDEGLGRLRESGFFGELQDVYPYVVLEHKNAFRGLLIEVSQALSAEQEWKDCDEFVEQCREVLRFTETLHLSFDENLELIERKLGMFSFDIAEWRTGGYGDELQRAAVPCEYEFYLPEEQKEFLRRQLEQFKSPNISATLFNMGFDTLADSSFYRVRWVIAASDSTAETDPGEVAIRNFVASGGEDAVLGEHP